MLSIPPRFIDDLETAIRDDPILGEPGIGWGL
jgi:hypothetical protein